MPVPRLTSQRLILSELKLSDVNEIRFLRSDPGVNHYIKRTVPRSKKETLDVMRNLKNGVKKGDWYFWRIGIVSQKELIGTICLWNFSADKTMAEVGYDLMPSNGGQGYMSEALQLVLDFGFNTIHLDEIEAFTHFDNQKSLNLLHRYGFVLVDGKKDLGNEDNVVFQLGKKSFQMNSKGDSLYYEQMNHDH